MKPIKMIGLALLMLSAMAIGDASAAMAEPTALCTADGGKCSEANTIAHIHESTLAGHKAVLLNSLKTIECDVLFLGEATAGIPLMAEGEFTYSNCTSACVVKMINGPVIVEVSKEGHESAMVTDHEGEVKAECSGISCSYSFEGVEGTAKGSLLSSETNGSNTVSEKLLTKTAGLLCPKEARLDITTTPLEEEFLTEAALKMVCVNVGNNNGLLLGTNAEGTACTDLHSTYAGSYELGYAASGTGRNEMACIWIGANKGYFLRLAWNFFSSYCGGDDTEYLTRKGQYELGVTQ
jgi:hypothetical protein